MGRKQTLIVYPHLNNCGGDLSKDWYVEFKYRVPGNPKLISERIYKGLQTGTVDERTQNAEKIIHDKRNWLDQGGHLSGLNKSRVYVDELEYSSVTRLYGKLKNELPTIRQNISEYLTEIKKEKTPVTFSNYQTKLRTFAAYLVRMKLDVDISKITRKHIVSFLIYLSDEMKLSRQTIKDYRQVIGSYFNYELENDRIAINPVVRMPMIGQIVDNAAVPFTEAEKSEMKRSIQAADLQLWLACQIQYYCAIRPGHELRLMQISWIDFDRKQFRIPCTRAKNTETEIVDIPDVLINEMLSVYQLDTYPGNYFVFGTGGKPGTQHYGKNTLRNKFNRFRDKLGISKSKVFYSWKHSGAIDLIEAGMQPYNVQEHLRHKSFSTTEKYLKKRIKSDDRRVNRYIKPL